MTTLRGLGHQGHLEDANIPRKIFIANTTREVKQ